MTFIIILLTHDRNSTSVLCMFWKLCTNVAHPVVTSVDGTFQSGEAEWTGVMEWGNRLGSSFWQPFYLFIYFGSAWVIFVQMELNTTIDEDLYYTIYTGVILYTPVFGTLWYGWGSYPYFLGLPQNTNILERHPGRNGENLKILYFSYWKSTQVYH